MKRIIYILMITSLIVLSMNVITVCADSSDTMIQAKIDELFNLVGNQYFTVNRTHCLDYFEWGHRCNNCNTQYIVNASWFKSLFGNISTNQFPITYYNDGVPHGRFGSSCFGFASFAEWYIFKSTNADIVNTNYIGTYDFNYFEISAHVKKGDLLRLKNSHSVIFLSANSAGIEVMDSNYATKDKNCKVTKHTIGYDYADKFAISRAQNRNIITEAPPSNVTISADKYEAKVGETINLHYTIDNATNSSYLVLYYNNENHFIDVNSSSGTVPYTFTETGRYYIYTKGSNDYGTSDCNGIWITVNEIPPNNVTISAIDTNYYVGETITLNYTIDRAWNSSYLVLYYNNENHYIYFNGSPGSIKYTFTEPGHYYIYTKGSNDAGTSDCYGLHIDVTEPVNLGDEFYAYITNPYSNMAIIHDDSNNAVIWERNDSYDQLWKFMRTDNGSYKIKSVRSGLCLDVDGASSLTDAKVQVYEENDTSAQKWFIHEAGDNYRLRAMCTEYILDIKNAVYANGTPLQTVYEHGDPAQRFAINKVDTYTVNYNSNDESNLCESEKKIHNINLNIAECAFIRQGYRFLGWSVHKNATIPDLYANNVYSENKNLELYAVWEKTSPYVEAKVIGENTTYLVEVIPHNIEQTCRIIVAGYNDNQLIDVEEMEYTSAISKFYMSSDVDKVKIMILSSLENLRPLCISESITKNEFVTKG